MILFEMKDERVYRDVTIQVWPKGRDSLRRAGDNAVADDLISPVGRFENIRVCGDAFDLMASDAHADQVAFI